MGLVCNDAPHPEDSNLKKEVKNRLAKTKIFKKKVAIVNFFAIITALYLYNRHNRYCEPGVYSLFSLLEYVVIVANVVYHLQAYYDLGDYSITIHKLESDNEQSPPYQAKID